MQASTTTFTLGELTLLPWNSIPGDITPGSNGAQITAMHLYHFDPTDCSQPNCKSHLIGFATHYHSLVMRMFTKIFNSTLDHLCNAVSLLLVWIDRVQSRWLIIARAQSTLRMKMVACFYSTR